MKKIIATFLAIALVLSLAACGGVTVDGASSPAGNSGEGGGSVSSRPVKDPYNDEIKLAYIAIGSDTTATAWGDGMEREVSNFSNITFQRFLANGSLETMVQQMDDLISQGYDGIVLQSIDQAGMADSVQRAEAAGIPVVTVNLDAATPHAALVTMVDVAAGELTAQQIGEALNGEGKVVIIQATPGATRGENLESGFRSMLASNYPNIEILDAQSANWKGEEAQVLMNDFLTKYEQIDAVFCHNDAMAEGAAQACEAAGRTDIMIWGSDGESKALEYIEQGRMTGTIYTNTYDQGATCIRLLMYCIASGIDTSALESTPVINMAPVIVTKDTVGDIAEADRW